MTAESIQAYWHKFLSTLPKDSPYHSRPVFGLRLDDPATPELGQLRSEFGDAVVAGAAGELEKLVRLTKWTSEQWVHSPTQMASKADPITILREGRAGGRFICRDYAIVTAGAARAFGFASRVISVLPRDVETRSEAHAVAEAWLPGRAKWALADGQYGIVPTRDGVPLNAVELQAALARGEPLVCLGAAARCEEWKWFVGRILFYFKVAEDQRPSGVPSPRTSSTLPGWETTCVFWGISGKSPPSWLRPTCCLCPA